MQLLLGLVQILLLLLVHLNSTFYYYTEKNIVCKHNIFSYASYQKLKNQVTKV